jgi:apolipoprotein D and lipocalin family protein
VSLFTDLDGIGGRMKRTRSRNKNKLRRNWNRAFGFCLCIVAIGIAGCAPSQPDLRALDRRIDVGRFMGDWFVVAFIPIDFPLFSEANAHDAVESYRLNDQGEIDISYSFRDGGFDAEPTVLTQRGWIEDPERPAEWKVQIMWPFESAYLIAWVDEQYDRAIVGVPSRSNVWLLSREAHLTETEFDSLLSRVSDMGYERTEIQRVPHRLGR